jgi:excisionase family DNA binding protein
MRRRLIPVRYVEWTADDPQEYVSIDRLARMVGISRSTAYRLRRAGKLPLPVGRLGRGLRFRRDDVHRWAQSGFPSYTAELPDSARCV